MALEARPELVQMEREVAHGWPDMAPLGQAQCLAAFDHACKRPEPHDVLGENFLCPIIVDGAYASLHFTKPGFYNMHFVHGVIISSSPARCIIRTQTQLLPDVVAVHPSARSF